MEDKLIIIDDLSNVISGIGKPKVKIKKYIFSGIISAILMLIMRILFIIPIYYFSDKNNSFLKLYNMRYTYSIPSYDEVWRYFRDAFFSVFQNGNGFIKYMFIAFLFLSILLVLISKSPIGILISFITIIVSPYIIPNIFLPVMSFIYVLINFITVFIDNLIPKCISIFLGWVILGFIFGIVYSSKNKKNKIIIGSIIIIILLIIKVKFPVENNIELKTFF